jgi:hypothetical protein
VVSVVTPAAPILTYKAQTTPFASEPLTLNTAGSFTSGTPEANSDDLDSEILQTDVSVL